MGACGSNPKKKKNEPEPDEESQESRREGNIARSVTHRDAFKEYLKANQAYKATLERIFRQADTTHDDSLSPDELRILFHGVDPDVLNSFIILLDEDKDGKVSHDEFLTCISLLTKGCSTPEQQIDASFTMFDMDHSGTISRDEFNTLIKVSVNIVRAPA